MLRVAHNILGYRLQGQLDSRLVLNCLPFGVAKMSRVKLLNYPSALLSLTLCHELWASYARLDEVDVFILHGN
jgi:hypothetical protein